MSTLVFPRGSGKVTTPPGALYRRGVSTAELGELVTTAGGHRQQREICMPWTGESLGSVPVCTAEDVQAALEIARAGQKTWARRSLAERKAIFARYHDLILQRQDEMMDVLQLESGKSRKDALEEVLDVAINSRHYAYHAGRYLNPRRRRGALPIVTETWEIRHPVGVVGVIAPWNYPLILAVTDAIPAMMAGNTIVLKPADETPLTALYAMRLLREAGLPYEVFQIFTGPGRVIGPPLIEGSNFLMFTGSTSTGRKLAQQAAEQLISYSMELGGKNPALVLEDADLDQAAEGMVRGAFSNAGQMCISIERLYVQSSIYQPFMERFLERTRHLSLGPALDYSYTVGSLVSAGQLQTVKAHVQDAVQKGARVLTGGKHRPDLGPYFFEPTVLDRVTPEMDLFAEETFGPVVAVYPFNTVEEGLEMANRSQYGLNAAIWSRNTGRALRLAQKLETGTVNINEPYGAAWASVDAPMGGRKASGVGRRHGSEGILKYTEAQTIAVQRGIPLAPFGPFKLRYFAMLMTAVLLLMKRIPGLR